MTSHVIDMPKKCRANNIIVSCEADTRSDSIVLVVSNDDSIFCPTLTSPLQVAGSVLSRYGHATRQRDDDLDGLPVAFASSLLSGRHRARLTGPAQLRLVRGTESVLGRVVIVFERRRNVGRRTVRLRGVHRAREWRDDGGYFELFFKRESRN